MIDTDFYQRLTSHQLTEAHSPTLRVFHVLSFIHLLGHGVVTLCLCQPSQRTETGKPTRRADLSRLTSNLSWWIWAASLMLNTSTPKVREGRIKKQQVNHSHDLRDRQRLATITVRTILIYKYSQWVRTAAASLSSSVNNRSCHCHTMEDFSQVSLQAC